MIRIAMYFGVGILCALTFEGQVLNLHNLWTYVWLLAWPLGLLIVSFKWAAILMVALFAVVGVLLWKNKL